MDLRVDVFLVIPVSYAKQTSMNAHPTLAETMQRASISQIRIDAPAWRVTAGLPVRQISMNVVPSHVQTVEAVSTW